MRGFALPETSRPEAFEMARHEKEATLKKFQSDDRDLSHHYRAVVTREVYRSRAQIAPVGKSDVLPISQISL